MNTKEKILKEALTLFSERGYSDVFVGDIADAVGIKAPSLYKHYKNKQEIFDSCVSSFFDGMNQVRNELLLPGTVHSTDSYETVDLDTIVEFSVGLFIYYLRADVASKFRKMLMIERYRNSEINKMYENLFIIGAVEYEEGIFSKLIEAGVLKKENPHVIALRFYSPIFYLLQKYDMHPEKEEEAKIELSELVREFCNTYKNG